MTPEQYIDSTTLAVCEEFARDVKEDIKETLDVSYPPASKRGESPRRRSGDLKDGIVSEVVQYGHLTQVAIISTAPYSIYLEDPARLDRPFMEPAQEKWTPILVERLREAFSGSSPVVSPAGAITPGSVIVAA